MKEKRWMRHLALFMAAALIGAAPLMAMRPEAARKINKSSISLDVGKKYSLKVKGVKKAKWSSSNRSVATVNGKGRVTAKKRGTAVVRARAGGRTYSCKVTVRQPVKSVALNKKAVTLTKVGQTYALKATVRPKNVVKWSSSNKGVATVTKKGVVKARGRGQCVITATVNGKTASCLVTVKTAGSSSPSKKCVHAWDNGKVTTAATCEAEGVKTYTCRLCGKTKTRAIDKTEHKWGEVGITVYPTCGEEGVMEYECSACGKRKNVSIPAHGAHEWDDGIVTVPATCHSDGAMTCTCRVCGQKSERPIRKGGNHVWDAGTVTKEPTCSKHGTKVYKCTVCGATRDESIPCSQNHDFGEWETTVAPTCHRGGLESRSCRECSQIESRSLPPLEHDWVYHEEQGHYGDADVYIPSAEVCNQCKRVFIYRKNLPYYLEKYDVTEEEILAQGYTIADDAATAVILHAFNDGVITNGQRCSNYSNLGVPITKHDQWIVDYPEYYQCSLCGETKYQ